MDYHVLSHSSFTLIVIYILPGPLGGGCRFMKFGHTIFVTVFVLNMSCSLHHLTYDYETKNYFCLNLCTLLNQLFIFNGVCCSKNVAHLCLNLVWLEKHHVNIHTHTRGCFSTVTS